MKLALAVFTSVTCLWALPARLERTTRFDGSPRLAQGLWLALGITGFTGVVCGLSQIATGSTHGSLLRLVVEGFELVTGRPQPLPRLSQVVALTCAVNLFVLCGGSLMVTTLRVRARHLTHRAALEFVSHYDVRWPDVALVELPTPVAYFIPGKGGQVVVARELVMRLSERHVNVIVAHEDGHRHQSFGCLLALRSLLPFVGFLAYARLSETVLTRILEFSADDYASRRLGRQVVREALIAVMELDHPQGSSPCNQTLRRRIERLSDGRHDASRPLALSLLGFAGLLTALLVVS